MVSVINPKVSVIGFGPNIVLENGSKITPDEIVYGAAGIAYKDIGALKELIELKEDIYEDNGQFFDVSDFKKRADFSKKITRSLIRSAGGGHASMATTPGMWVFLEGNCSKLVDSIFTTARFGSSLMPSGRRVPVIKENIVVPEGVEANGKAREIYVSTIEKDIDAYEKLQEIGVPKEEAAKIVPYGHKGGGFMYMPLETLIYFSRESERAGDFMPAEGRIIIRELEKFAKNNGMGVIFEARKAAPRTTSVNPSIFHKDNNLAHELMKIGYKDIFDSYGSVLLNSSFIGSPTSDKRIQDFIRRKEEVFANPERIEKEWPNLLTELQSIVTDYNDSVTIKTLTNTPWRVWGEVKRHRALPQTAESVYHATERAIKIVNKPEDVDSRTFSIPQDVLVDSESLKIWTERVYDSINAYKTLLDMGIKESDAINVIPRGLKFGIVKNWDLYNLTTGYMSLRLCKTAEKEMREITEKERDLIGGTMGYNPIRNLLVPKCNYVGHCTDLKFCKNVLNAVPGYNLDLHKSINKARNQGIESRLVSE